MSEECQCGCHGKGGFGGSIDKPCCECTGTNFVKVTAMSSVEIETGIKKCMGCDSLINECKCVWSAIRQLQHRLDTLIYDLHDWKDNITKSLQGIESSSTPFKVFIEQHTNDERHRARHEKLINSLGFELIEVKEALRFIQNEKNYLLPSLSVLNQKVHSELEKIKKKVHPSRSKLEQTLHEKNSLIKEMQKNYDDLLNEYEEDSHKNIIRIKELQAVIALRNKEIHDLQNPNPMDGVGYEGDSCEPIKKTGIDRYGNEVPINEQTR